MKLLLRIVGGLLALIALALVVALVRGHMLLTATRHDAPRAFTAAAASDTAAIAHGRYLAATRCTGCHSANASLPLSGGIGMVMGPIATLYPPNLTPGGHLAHMTD